MSEQLSTRDVVFALTRCASRGLNVYEEDYPTRYFTTGGEDEKGAYGIVALQNDQKFKVRVEEIS